jgi:hypothetical protein
MLAYEKMLYAGRRGINLYLQYEKKSYRQIKASMTAKNVYQKVDEFVCVFQKNMAFLYISII